MFVSSVLKSTLSQLKFVAPRNIVPFMSVPTAQQSWNSFKNWLSTQFCISITNRETFSAEINLHCTFLCFYQNIAQKFGRRTARLATFFCCSKAFKETFETTAIQRLLKSCSKHILTFGSSSALGQLAANKCTAYAALLSRSN